MNNIFNQHIAHRAWWLLSLILMCTACDLLDPGEVRNPNVEESDFARSPDAMLTWVNGTQARFASGLASLAENVSILSDDVWNNSSRSNKTWDKLEIYYTDGEIRLLSTRIGEMIEMADYGLETLAHTDKATTPAQQFNLCYIKAIAYLLAAENFVVLPKEAHGKALSPEELLRAALEVLTEADTYASAATEKAFAALLKARAYRLLRNREQAERYAELSIRTAADLLVVAQFDDLNGVPNTLQNYVATELFSVLPRLSAQKAKCPKADFYNQPLAIGKSEEAYLILAEAAIASGHLHRAQEKLLSLLALVGLRESSVSITSVSKADVEQAAAHPDALLEMVYLLRQEIFFAEGRRASDLGIRLPLSEIEYLARGSARNEMHKLPIIPAYLDSIRTRIDELDDLNRRIVEAKQAICPFEMVQ